jgi:hypothetical protein
VSSVLRPQAEPPCVREHLGVGVSRRLLGHLEKPGDEEGAAVLWRASLRLAEGERTVEVDGMGVSVR